MSGENVVSIQSLVVIPEGQLFLYHSLHSFIVHYFLEIYNLIDFQIFIKLVGNKFLHRHNSQINGYHILGISIYAGHYDKS